MHNQSRFEKSDDQMRKSGSRSGHNRGFSPAVVEGRAAAAAPLPISSRPLQINRRCRATEGDGTKLFVLEFVTISPDIVNELQSQFHDKNFNVNMEHESNRKRKEREQNQGGRKPYERHTYQQKIKLEEYFAMSQHPDEKDRIQIGKQLGVDPARVKFWFQNKRTQKKNKEIQNVNHVLMAEVEMLRGQIEVYKEALRSNVCHNCGGPHGDSTLNERLLRLENAQIKEELSKRDGKYCEKSLSLCPQPVPEAGPSNFAIASSGSLPNYVGNNVFGVGNSTGSDHISSAARTENANVILEIAEAAADELLVMAESGEPLWLPAGPDSSAEILNEQVYLCNVLKWSVTENTFGLMREATRATTTVNMNARNLVEILSDSKKWSALFSGIVLRARTMEVHTRGRNCDGALQKIFAEYHLPSPLVPTRECLFLRYCKNLPAERTWIVVDISLDTFPSAGPANRCRRRPSGCLIREIDDKSLKVIWVEHVEAHDRLVHGIYKPVVNSGIVFGAKRWLATLNRQSNRLTSVMNCTIPNCSEDERANQTKTQIYLLKLAERMLLCFSAGVVGSIAHGWVNETGTSAKDVRVASRRNVCDTRMPCGITLSASSSVWLPATPRRVFDFLCDDNNRTKWDTLFENGTLVEVANIPIGIGHGNRISLLHLNGLQETNDAIKKTMDKVIQESCFDDTCSYVVYAPVDTRAMNGTCMYGGDPDTVQLLPSGFTVVPDGPLWMTNGSLVTVSFQILADPNPHSDLSPAPVEVVKSLVTSVVRNIKNAVLGHSSSFSESF